MATDAAPPFEEDQQQDAVEAPDTGISQNEDAPFNINDIEDEAVRSEVEKYQKQLQGSYTRKTQELASQRAEMEQYRQAHEYIQGLQTDPATRQALFQELAAEHGYTLEDEESDPLSALQARQEALEAQIAQQAQQAQEAQWVATLEAQVEQDLKPLNLTARQEKLIVDAAASRPLTAEGHLDVKGVYQEYLDGVADANKAQRASKKAPHVARAGVAGQAKVDLSDEDVRQSQMLAIVQAHTDD